MWICQAFLETAGEVEEGDRLSLRPSLKNAVREATTLTAGKPNAKLGKQAPPLLLKLVVSLEHAVLEAERPLYQRVFA